MCVFLRLPKQPIRRSSRRKATPFYNDDYVYELLTNAEINTENSLKFTFRRVPDNEESPSKDEQMEVDDSETIKGEEQSLDKTEGKL